MRFEGGVGVDFCVAVGAFSMRVENKIIFIDVETLMLEQLDRLYSYEIESKTNGRLM